VSLPVTVKRLGIRAAYRALQVVWLVTRPRKQGVKCVLTDRDRVLLVRHSYGCRDWDLPGGAIKRGEAPRHAARREMDEELGVRPPHWVPLGSVAGRNDHRRDTIHVFGAQVGEGPLRLDLGELLTAGWFQRDELPEVRPLAAHVLRHTLGRAIDAAAHRPARRAA